MVKEPDRNKAENQRVIVPVPIVLMGDQQREDQKPNQIFHQANPTQHFPEQPAHSLTNGGEKVETTDCRWFVSHPRKSCGLSGNLGIFEQPAVVASAWAIRPGGAFRFKTELETVAIPPNSCIYRDTISNNSIAGDPSQKISAVRPKQVAPVCQIQRRD